MARRLGLAIGCLAALLLMLFTAGCGVKTLPLSSIKASPPRVGDIKAMNIGDGIEITFTVPREDKPSRRISEVRLFYGVLPITGDPDCPPCPPKLRRYKAFNLTGPAADLMEGGKFTYLDKSVPMGKMAAYQVVLVDASGRKSKPSMVARAPRAIPAEPPEGLFILGGNEKVTLSWDDKPPTKLTGEETEVHAGWFVFRRDPNMEPDEYIQLTNRPLTKSYLVDKTVENDKVYSYQVMEVRKVKNYLVPGTPTKWANVTPKDDKPPLSPSDLAAASMPDGVYLRFTPSPDQDTAGYIVYRRDWDQAKADAELKAKLEKALADRTRKIKAMSKTERVKATRAGLISSPVALKNEIWSEIVEQGAWHRLNTEPSEQNTYVDKTAAPGKVYMYRVASIDDSGNMGPVSAGLVVDHQP